MNMRIILFFAAALAVAGCKNPADDVPSATVNQPAEAADEGSADEATSQPAGEEGAVEEAVEEVAATTIALDASNLKVEFVGSKVTASHDGGFNAATGEVTIPATGVTAATISVNIDTTSIYTDNERLTGHLQSDDFFNVAEFPQATFTSTDIAEGDTQGVYNITGNLEMHGQTNSVTFPATITVDGENVSANAEFSINRHDWGIVYAGMPDDLIRDEVVIKLTINTAGLE